MAIINQVVAGGGTTPTGTISITSNGTHDVTNYATADVQVPTTAPAEPYLEYSINNQGKLTSNTSRLVDLTGVEEITDIGIPCAYYKNTNITGTVKIPVKYVNRLRDVFPGMSGGDTFVDPFFATYCKATNITAADLSGVLLWGVGHITTHHDPVGQFCFSGSGIITVDMSNATKINFGSGMFSGCTSLTTIDISSAEKFGGAYVFSGDTNLTNVLVNDSGFVLGQEGYMIESYNIFAGCTSLVKNPLDKVTEIAGRATQALYRCSSITKVEHFYLQEIKYSLGGALLSTYRECTGLITAKFDSVKTIGRQGMMSTFNGCTSLQSVWFYALDTNSFGTRTDQFYDMLDGCTNVTVHFPIRIQSTIGSWSDVTNGFGGTNTTVLFDIVTTLTGADGNTYTRQEKDSTTTATAWVYNDTLYYTSGVSDNANGVNEPAVSDAIYSDAACTQSVTTITAIA